MFKYRGIIEGFYGQPWSQEERLQLFSWMAENGYTDYIYAPKKDSYHRANWRQPYPNSEKKKFVQLIESAEKMGVNFYMAISPGLSLEYSAPKDRQILSEKLKSFIEMGVSGLGIFFDDIPLKLHHSKDLRRYKNLATAQIDLVNRLAISLQLERAGEMIFCPTVYSGFGDDQYLRELGRGLAPHIEIFWTGREICSAKIQSKDLALVTDALERKVIIWDNYPVNDAMMTPELHLGPYVGREPDLGESVAGFFINPMNQFQASLITLKAIGLYLNNPRGYNPETSLLQGIREVVGKDLAETFFHFTQYNLISPLHNNQLSALAKIWQRGEFTELKEESLKMKQTAQILLQGLHQKDLGQEIRPWLLDFLFYSELGLQIAEVEKVLRYLFNFPEGKDMLKAFLTLQLKLNRLKRFLKKVPNLQTAVTGEWVNQRGLRTYRSIEGLIKIYIDERQGVFKILRWLLKKF